MKLLTIAAALSSLASAASFSKEEYESGQVMAWMMEAKESAWAEQKAAGNYNSRKWNGWNKHRGGRDKVACKNGYAVAVKGDPDQTYKCKDIDMYDFKTHEELGSPEGEGSGSWGWSHKGRDFYAIGQTDGTAFIEITKQGRIVYLGRLPQQSVPVIWREIKTAGNYLIVGSEAVDHGVQIFDLRKLLKVNPKRPQVFSTTRDLTGFWNELPIGRSHNVVVNEEKNYAVAVGAQPRNDTCASGLIFINIDDPSKPYSPGCAPQDGYVHDAQCIVYRGPHKKYFGRDICYGYNEDTLTIYDVSNKNGKNASRIISRTPYVGASYTHQGWVLDPNWQTHLILDDELDEGEINATRTAPDSPAKDGFPVTYIFDITNLEKPVNTGYYKSSVRSVDHNQFVYNGLAYQSNYQAGLRILDVSSIPEDPTGGSVEEIAYFDTYPTDDNLPGGGQALWNGGTWSHYTFPSGWIAINTIDRGVFTVRLNKFPGKGYGKRWVDRSLEG
ncbi:hypothetical protein BU24DRAFT_445137 [Aaosphaeria arxii CBS 175.79]|uniref:Uncharacterized protein n=1 Tax=Aaosphaeria arxii CBS 175.79 TaxID=1450172 RepID=A0A6A5X8N5_9PLEO|nr:uncharacterized protein BU24DRAFT_445137 [Aaosphaeria arxii CBS 175.79]KAF2009259.1 hypothetical protein BU24DRAFT_445137 [Aaosphaeria arxii CBS 175.79]